MTQFTYVQFDKTTGEYTGCMTCSTAQAMEQVGTTNTSMLKVAKNPLVLGTSEEGVPTYDFDWDIIRTAIAADINAQAEAVYLQFIPAGATQAARYARKEAEARAWLADDSVAIPVLEAEATALSKTIPDLVAEVIAKADTWIEVMAIVEAKRLAAKQALQTLTNIGAMAEVAQIDWSA